jgi:hypothetical protein
MVIPRLPSRFTASLLGHLITLASDLPVNLIPDHGKESVDDRGSTKLTFRRQRRNPETLDSPCSIIFAKTLRI